MPERISRTNIDRDRNVDKKDLDIILEVNRKSIEIETEVAAQNEEVISKLSNIEDSLKKNAEKFDKLERDFFTYKMTVVSLFVPMIIQIILFLVKK